jgi:hypothetical protein
MGSLTLSSLRGERRREALAESRLASELDPLSPMIAMSEPWQAVLEGRHEVAMHRLRPDSCVRTGVTRSGGRPFPREHWQQSSGLSH